MLAAAFLLSFLLSILLLFLGDDLFPSENMREIMKIAFLAIALFFSTTVISTIINGNITLFGKKENLHLNKRKFLPPLWLQSLPLLLVFVGVIGYLLYWPDMILKGNTGNAQNIHTYKSAGTISEISGKVPDDKVNTTTEVVKKVTQTDLVQCNMHANCGGGYKMMSVTECSNTICCAIHSNCGGGFRIMSKNECSEKTCCEIDGKWTYISSSDCVEKQKEEYKDKYEDYLRNIEENDDYEYVPPTPSQFTYPTKVTNNDIQCSYGSTYLGKMSYEDCLDEIKKEKEKLLQECISDAAEAREDAEISWRNTARSYGIISSSEFLVRLNQINSTYESIVNSCKSAYGD